ncbi:serine/threonine protein kinase [Friedmanniella luteola]|uniref:non-specific serine/threonine protein kinase n=1 Tax=Friedmanniella luteola TaxID=546871 RepID=A0A1H1ZLJ1_9ACTN|nr:Stk1 family PASTA domain-containing Ser/Thr kinase [Friedmanniella luteola]SDT34096.1 serine/threonine protein kinase [Friedmanniella luteola]
MSGEPVVVGDRYELGEPLGQGGMATVHRALDRRLDRAVAVKRLGLHLAADPTAQARFRREAQASASLNHPAIASVFDTGEGADPATGVSLPYIVMELVEGSTLRTILDAGPLPPERALRITRSVLDALAHSHAMGLVHRDIKPANVMITTDGAVKVMDFGIARAVDESATSLTKTASVIGTAQYLSPEQALGQTVDLRSDLYSVGCLLFELVTGRPPFVGDTSLAIAYQHVREQPVPPSRLDPSLEPGLDAVVLRALTKDPADRYQTAAEMRDDVDRLLAGQAVAPPPPPSSPAATADTAALPGRLVAAPAAATATAAAGTDGSSGSPTAPTALVGPAAGAPSPADPSEPPDRRRSAAGRAVLVALAVFLVLGLGAFGLFRVFGPAADGAAAVTVPDVDGQPREQAEAALRDADLVPRVTPTAGKDDKTVGTVLDQAPAADARVAAGTTVTLRVNAGPATAAIPDDLVGRPVADVEAQLEDLGFTDVSTEAVDGDGEVDPGDVVSVKPGEGKEAALDAAVRVRFARATEATTSGGGGTQTRAPTRSSAPSASADDDEAGGPTSDPGGDATSEAPDDDEPTSEAPTSSAPTTRSPTSDPEPTASATSTATEEPTKKAKKAKPTSTHQGRGQGQGQGGD